MRFPPRAVLIVLLALAATPGSAADSLGRLFMTPEQRQSLDAQRDRGGEPLAAVLTDSAPEPAPLDRQVLLNGIVQRSRGPDVAWVNGVRTDGAAGRVRLQRGPDQSRRVTLRDATDGTTVRLKPGQYWEPATGRVANCYGCSTPAKPAGNPPQPAEAAADKP